MRINNNMMAMNTHRQLGVANEGGAKSMEKLSSGMRINRAGDDAAGLAISEKMRGQIRGLNQASSNAQDGISLIQTAEGALNETHAILQRMRELSVQASSDTNVEADRGEIQKEIDQLAKEIDRIGDTTEFNTMKLVNGDRASGVTKTDIKEIKNFEAKGLSYATGVTSTGEKFALKDDAITIDPTASWAATGDNDEAGTVKITKQADGTLKVEINSAAAGSGTAATNPLVSEDILEADENGNFKYDNHGVTFEISAKDYKAGDDITIALTKTEVTAGTKATASDYTATTAVGETVATVGDLAVSKVAGYEGIVEMKATWAGDNAGDGKLTVVLEDAEGNELSRDAIDTTDGTVNYNNHGVSFKFDAKQSTAVDFGQKFEQETIEKSNTTGTDKSLKFQVGANENQKIDLAIEDMRAGALNVDKIDVSSHEKAEASITTINNAIERVSGERSKLGAAQNRLEHTIKNLDTSAENLQASEARIRDVDMAKEMMEQTKQNILAQASTAMLANANSAPQSVLQLLG